MHFKSNAWKYVKPLGRVQRRDEKQMLAIHLSQGVLGLPVARDVGHGAQRVEHLRPTARNGKSHHKSYC